MGGSRCSFQNCPNSSYNSPNTHFFHYPIKDKERCAEWVRRANNISILNLPLLKLKNKVVCDKHFDIKSFMNYKREKLLFNAIPECGENFVEINAKLDTSPIKSNCTSDFTLLEPGADDTKFIVKDLGSSGLIFSDKLNSKNESIYKFSKYEPKRIILNNKDSVNDTIDVTIKKNEDYLKSPDDIHTVSISKQYTKTSQNKSLNKIYINKALDITKNVSNFEEKLTNNQLEATKNSQSDNMDVKRIKLDLVNEQKPDKYFMDHMTDVSIENMDAKSDRNIKEVPNILQVTSFEKSEKYNELDLLKMKYNGITTVKQKAPIKPSSKIKMFNSVTKEQLFTGRSIENMDAQSDRNIKEIPNGLQVTSLEKSDKYNELDLLKMKYNGITSVKQKALIKPNSKVRKFNSMTKDQLFTGIKKYISPSMAILLQMELYGTLDRIWQPEEKQLSLELMNLGEDVYQYMTEEFRWRLPSPSLVKKWEIEDCDEEMEFSIS